MWRQSSVLRATVKAKRYLASQTKCAQTSLFSENLAAPHPINNSTCFTRTLFNSAASSSDGVPSTMAGALVRVPGGLEAIEIREDIEVPKLKPSDVLVRNSFAGVNFIDTYHRSGLYKRDLPFVMGQEGSGVIAAVSDEAAKAGWATGDRVAYSVLQTYSEFAAVPASKLLKVPDSVPLDKAACCPVQGLTAHYLVTDCHANLIKPGEWMLIHGVGGGTCQWAAQMAKTLGYKVIGTVSKSKADVGKATGVDELIVLEEAEGTSYEDYTSVDVVKKVMAITNGEGVKAVIDGVGLATWEISLDSLARRGIFVSFGNASGTVPAYPPLKHIGKSSYMTRPKLLDYVQNPAELKRRSDDVFTWIQEGKLKVDVDKTFSLADTGKAHKYLESGASRGKVLLKI